MTDDQELLDVLVTYMRGRAADPYGWSCRSVTGSKRQYICLRPESHNDAGIPCYWFNMHPDRGEDPDIGDHGVSRCDPLYKSKTVNFHVQSERGEIVYEVRRDPS